MILVSSFVELVQQLSPVMTAPTFESFVTVLIGWVFARRRNVTKMILAADAVDEKHHSAFHRVFAAAQWSLDALGLLVFALILPWLNDGQSVLAIDDTLARKRGLKVYGVGMHHDPLISSRKKALTNWGHSWVVLGVIVKFPFCADKFYCLPILFRLYISKQTIAKKGGVYRTRPELAVEMLQVLCVAHSERSFHAVADSAYGGQSVLGELPSNCDLTSRLDLDARLYDAPPKRKPKQQGRTRKRGRKLPTPKKMLEGRTKTWTLKLYGRRDRVRMADAVGRAHAVPDRPLRIVAVNPITGGRGPQAFYSTRTDDTALDVLTRYAMRWSIEEANQNSKGHLGFEEPQGWTRRAVERTAPTAMLLYSLILLWFAKVGHRHYQPLYAPWYQSKNRASFGDMLATLRRESVREQVSAMAPSGKGCRKLMHVLFHAVQQAA
jgi:hypothetical protein